MKNIRKIKIILVISILIGMCMSTKSHAGLQANKPNENLKSLVRTTAGNFFTLIREMESKTGTLAVDADTNDSKNGIDCHMVKATEWGTAALMAASSFGVIPKSGTSNSTTGNESGIYQMSDGYYEYTTGYINGITYKSSQYDTIVNADNKYKNIYESGISTYYGDGLEVRFWCTF